MMYILCPHTGGACAEDCFTTMSSTASTACENCSHTTTTWYYEKDVPEISKARKFGEYLKKQQGPGGNRRYQLLLDGSLLSLRRGEDLPRIATPFIQPRSRLGRDWSGKNFRRVA